MTVLKISASNQQTAKHGQEVNKEVGKDLYSCLGQRQRQPPFQHSGDYKMLDWKKFVHNLYTSSSDEWMGMPENVVG